MNNLEFARQISELRKAKGLSQKELGELLGVSNKAVSKWETGESMPKTSTMLKLSEILGIDVTELIGIESKADTNKLDELKNENDILKSQLTEIKTRKRKSLIAITAICVVCIIGAVLISFFINGDSRGNAKITDAGKADTRIVFDDTEFVVLNDLFSYVCDINKENFISSDKYADFYSADGKSTRVLIGCERYSDIISLQSKGKTYYYVKKDNVKRFELNANTVEYLMLYGGSVTGSEDHGIYEKTLYAHTVNEQDGKLAFDIMNFIENKTKPVEKKLVERFLGNKGIILFIDFEYGSMSNNGIYSSEIGEFFKDDKNNVYYYDYSTASAYPVGKELGIDVYKEN